MGRGVWSSLGVEDEVGEGWCLIDLSWPYKGCLLAMFGVMGIWLIFVLRWCIGI